MLLRDTDTGNIEKIMFFFLIPLPGTGNMVPVTDNCALLENMMVVRYQIPAAVQ
jgi:hypothetical protein